MSTLSHPFTPTGAEYLGPGEIGKHRFHEWRDLSTGSDFTVPEAQATAPMIEKAQREHRARFAAVMRCDVCSADIADHLGGVPCQLPEN